MGHGMRSNSPWRAAGHPWAAPGTWPYPFAGQSSSWQPLRRCGTCPTVRRLAGSGCGAAAGCRWCHSRRPPPPGPPTLSARQSGHRSSRSAAWRLPWVHRSAARGCADRRPVPAIGGDFPRERDGLVGYIRVYYMVFRTRREIRARFEANGNWRPHKTCYVKSSTYAESLRKSSGKVCRSFSFLFCFRGLPLSLNYLCCLVALKMNDNIIF